MGRVIGIDYGKKRTGIAISDPSKFLASPLETIATVGLLTFLKEYFEREAVDGIVIGMPKRLDNSDTHTTQDVRNLIQLLKSTFPDIPVYEEDERFTSKLALDAMISAGTTKKQRRDKGNIDKLSAAIILQSYLDFKQ